MSRVHSGVVPQPRTQAPPPPARGTRAHGTPIPVVFNWRDWALFKGQTRDNTSVWLYPHRNRDDDVNKALRLCAVCPVIAECRTHTTTPTGIVAGDVWVAMASGWRRAELKPCRTCKQPFYAGQGRTAYCSSECRSLIPPENECRAGHPRTPANTYIDPRGYKQCKVCKNITNAQWGSANR